MRKLLVAIPLAALLTLSCARVAHASTWEYKLVYESELYGIHSVAEAFAKMGETMSNAKSFADLAEESRTTLEGSLDSLGAEGWELVSVEEKKYLFKRRKSS